MGKPLLYFLIERIRKINEIQQIVVATTNRKNDDDIQNYCKDENIKCFRGSEEDVLERMYLAAKEFRADPIMRITADCPLIDPEVLYNQIKKFDKDKLDYSYLGLSFAEGICADLFTFSVLEEAHHLAKLKAQREHVTPYFHDNKTKFNILCLENIRDDSKYRIVVDTPDDFEVIKRIIEDLYKGDENIPSTYEIISYLDQNPDTYSLNSLVVRNESYDVFKVSK